MLRSWEKSPLGAAMQVSPRVINRGGGSTTHPQGKSQAQPMCSLTRGKTLSLGKMGVKASITFP